MTGRDCLRLASSVYGLVCSYRNVVDVPKTKFFRRHHTYLLINLFVFLTFRDNTQMDRWSDSSKSLYNGSYMNSGTKLSKYMIAVAAAGYKGWRGATMHDIHFSHIVCCE